MAVIVSISSAFSEESKTSIASNLLQHCKVSISSAFSEESKYREKLPKRLGKMVSISSAFSEESKAVQAYCYIKYANRGCFH